MRIEPYIQVQQAYQTKRSDKSQSASKTSFADQFQISSLGKDIQTAKNAVAAAPDVREEVVAPLKKAVNAGTYEVSGEQLAQKLFEKYNSTHLGSF